MATLSEKKEILELYIAWFNRVPDSAGLAFWINEYDNGSSLAYISGKFYEAAVTQFSAETGYSNGMSDSAFITQLYDGVMGRTGELAPNETEIAYWVNALNNDQNGDKGALVERMVNEIQAFDASNNEEIQAVKDKFANKVYVAERLALIGEFTGSIAEGKSILANVTHDVASISAVLDGGANSAYNLTNSTDQATANQFLAELVYAPSGVTRINSLQSDDQLTGSGTNPTLTAILGDASEGNTIAPIMNGIETLNLSFLGSSGNAVETLDLQNSTGVNSISIDRITTSNGEVSVANMASLVNNIAVSNVSSTLESLAFTFVADALTSTSDSLTVSLSGTNTNHLYLEAASNAPTEGIETINLISNGDSNTIGTLYAEDLKTLNLSGTAAISINGFSHVSGSLTTIDASSMSSNVSLNLDDAFSANQDNSSTNIALTVQTGSGNDQIQASTIGTTDSITLGEGTDRVTLSGNGNYQVISGSTWSSFSGVDELAFNNAGGGFSITLNDSLFAQADNTSSIAIINDSNANASLQSGDNQFTESNITLNARSLSANKNFSYDGEESSNGLDTTADTFQFSDTSLHSGVVIDGGDDNTTRAVQQNNDIIEIWNSATVNISDLSNIRNIGKLELHTDLFTDQLVRVSLNDTVLDAFDTSQTASSSLVETFTVELNGSVSTSADPVLELDIAGVSAEKFDITIENANDVLLGANGTINTQTAESFGYGHIIIGGEQSNDLNSAIGKDLLIGQAGSDSFVLGSATSGVTEATADVIADFSSGADRIEMGGTSGSDINYHEATAEVSNFAAAQTAANTVLNGTVRYAFEYDATQGYLFFDGNADGDINDGGIDVVVTLSGINHNEIVATDII
jgi:hypothetical protein